uniref:Uncharacterized protein n=1 Tax=Anopheles atroparvus TaxID=41427 RepID=A0A182ISR6_ANOAO
MPYDYERIKLMRLEAFGMVYAGRDRVSGKPVLMKIVHKKDGSIPQSIVGNISLLKQLQHRNLARLLNVVTELTCHILIFEHFPMDLGQYMRSLPPGEMLDPVQVKVYLHQITDAVLFCHNRQVLHRNLMPANLLIDAQGTIKVTDFDLPSSNWTEELGLLWYRAPEVLLGSTSCSGAADIWSIGCIFAELATRMPLFPGATPAEQLCCIFTILVTPTKENCPDFTDLLPHYQLTVPCSIQNKLASQVPNLGAAGIDLLKRCLEYNPTLRISAKQILEHEYFGPEAR